MTSDVGVGGGIESAAISAPPVPTIPVVAAGVPTSGVVAQEVKAIPIAETPTMPAALPTTESPVPGASPAEQAAVHIDQNLPENSITPGDQAGVIAVVPEEFNTATEASVGQAQTTQILESVAPNPGTTEPANGLTTETPKTEEKLEETTSVEVQEAVDANMQRILEYRGRIDTIDAQLSKTTDTRIAEQLHFQRFDLENRLRIEEAHYAREQLKQQQEAVKEGGKSQVAQDVEARITKDYGFLPDAVKGQIPVLVSEAIQSLIQALSNEQITIQQALPEKTEENITPMDLVKAAIKFFLRFIIQTMIDQAIIAAEQKRGQTQQPGAVPITESGGAITTGEQQGVISPPTTTEASTAPQPVPVTPIVSAL